MFTELLSGLASLFSEAGALGTHDNSKHIDFLSLAQDGGSCL